MQIESLSEYLAVKVNFPEFGKYNVKGKGMLSSAERAFVGRDEKRAPLKTPAWEATILCEGNLKTQTTELREAEVPLFVSLYFPHKES